MIMLRYKLAKRYNINGYHNYDDLVLDMGEGVKAYLDKKGLSTTMELRDPGKNRVGFKTDSGIEGKVVVFHSIFSEKRIRLKAKMKSPDSAEKQASDILSYLAAYVPFSKR